MAGRLAHDLLHGAAVAALGATIVLGSLLLWIGVPVGGLWLAGELTTSADRFLLLALCSIPTGIVVCGWLLYRVNRVYVRLRAGASTGPRTLIDVAMTASAWSAAVLMAIWFFFYAELTLVSW